MKPYPYLLFDLDGTLIDSREDLVQAVQEGFRRIGHTPPDADFIIDNIGKPLVHFPSLLGHHFTDDEVRNFVRWYRAFYAVHCGDKTRPFPGVVETLERFLAEGFVMAVVTTKSQDQAEGTVRTLGLTRYFRHIHGWQEGQKFKPDPEPILLTLKALDADPARTLMVGDSEQDILAAQAAGVDVAACLYGFRRPEYLISLNPTHKIERFSQLQDIVIRPD